jgi:hypothetical protein
MRSLGTSDRREAERLARTLGVELDREFERLRAINSPNNNELPNNQHIGMAAGYSHCQDATQIVASCFAKMAA